MGSHSTSMPVWRHTMRATDDLQTTISLGSVKPNAQAFSLELSLEMSLPTPRQDEHFPDQIEAYVHQAGLEVQRRGTRPFTFKTILGAVTVERSRISHNHDGTI